MPFDFLLILQVPESITSFMFEKKLMRFTDEKVFDVIQRGCEDFKKMCKLHLTIYFANQKLSLKVLLL